jgi:hypothetical protein
LRRMSPLHVNALRRLVAGRSVVTIGLATALLLVSVR